MKQNKKAKICFVIYIAGFFFKNNSVMKCLRSKKRKKSPVNTTYVRVERKETQRIKGVSSQNTISRDPKPCIAVSPLGQCNYVELIDTIFTDVEGVD
jgi:hypothetical protein